MLRAQRRLEFAPVVGRGAKAREESGLESPDSMLVGEQVALDQRARALDERGPMSGEPRPQCSREGIRFNRHRPAEKMENAAASEAEDDGLDVIRGTT